MTGTSNRSPSFSVVIPTRDRADRVVRQVERLQLLTEPPDEIVVVDDGSTDGTAAKLAALERPPLVVPGPGDGPATARNRGIEAASGDWMVFLDDDDEPHPGWMATFRRLQRSDPTAAHLSVAFVRRVGPTETVRHPAPLGPAFRSARANYVAGTFAVPRHDLLHLGAFAEGLRSMEFTDLALRWFDRHERTATTDEAVLTIVVRPPDHRASQQAATLDAAWLEVHRRNRAAFDRDPSFLANQLSTLGVAWARGGRPDRARHYLLAAARTRPGPRTLARAGLAMVPGAAQRVWGTGS